MTTSERARGRRLLARWERLLPHPSRIGSVVGEDLLVRWSAPTRRYHDSGHLSEVLDRLNRLPGGREVPVRLAAWFHDAVYEPTSPPGASEQASSALLQQLGPECGFEPPVVAEASRLVLLTSGHEAPADDVAAGALMDADLAILAAEPERYLDYAAGVRAEYAHLPDETFSRGRAAVLRELLERDPLFATTLGRTRWELTARANVAVELRMLRQS